MKKNLLAIISSTLIIFTSAPAMAATPIEFHGDIQYHFRVNNDDSLLYPVTDWSPEATAGHHTWGIPKHTTSSKYTLHLNATSKLSDDVSAYARVSAQTYNGDNNTADYFVPTYKSGEVSLDRFGIIFKDKNDITYNIGRQAPGIGATKLILSDWSVGDYMHAVDGISISGISGVTSYQLLAGDLKFWNYSNNITGNNQVYSGHVSYSPITDLTVGATSARFVPSSAYANDPFSTAFPSQSMSFNGMNASYNLGKLNLTAEYFKSSAEKYNRAYVARASYSINPKNSVSVAYGDVQQQASILCDIDAGGKGIYYGYNRDLGNGMWFNLNYNDMKWSDGNSAVGKKYNSLRMTLGYGF